MKIFFFDDEKLFGRENVQRVYGRPQLIADAVYRDGIVSTDYASLSVFACDDGKYRMIYMGRVIDTGVMGLFMAISDDGVHFTPENVAAVVSLPGRLYDHEVLKLSPEAEVGTVVEDPTAPPAERYKLLLCDGQPSKLTIDTPLYVSPDLYHWTVLPDVSWGGGNEPLVGAFYNAHRRCHTIIRRPFWGVRRAGYSETADWRTFSEFVPCVQCDANDEPLAEIYGMPAFAYDGVYIGFVHIYGGHPSSYGAKFNGGTMHQELAYSYEGRYWQRALRHPFTDGFSPDVEAAVGYPCATHWLSGMARDSRGDVLLYSPMTRQEHGPCFRERGDGVIGVYRLRKDGFMGLQTADAGTPSAVCTREKAWLSGELAVNLAAKRATVAVYESVDEVVEAPHDGEDRAMDFKQVNVNALGLCAPVPGYGHDDCEPFSGDDTAWVPRWTGGTLGALSGRTLAFEVKFEDGTLYSLAGDCAHLHNTEGARFRRYGTLPKE